MSNLIQSILPLNHARSQWSRFFCWAPVDFGRKFSEDIDRQEQHGALLEDVDRPRPSRISVGVDSARTGVLGVVKTQLFNMHIASTGSHCGFR